MARKIFSGTLIILSVLLLVLSLAAIVSTWVYKDPLTHAAVSRLNEVDAELIQAQAALQNSAAELERALRIVDSAQTALQELSLQSDSAENLLSNIQSTLDDRVLPELKTTRGRIGTARAALENLQSVLAGIRNFLPSIDLSAPDKIVTDLIDSTNSLDDEIANVEILVQQASTFVSDNSYLLGGDLSETRDSLQKLLASVQSYEKKVTSWHEQVGDYIKQTPTWVDRTAVGLTIFLLWFALSQFGLFLHGLRFWAGGNPFVVLKRERVRDSLILTDDEMV
jgi:DNA repair exonuclease SbcCD ATPase subunit